VISDIELLKFQSGYRMRLEVYFKARLAPEKRVQSITLQEQEVLDARFFDLEDLPTKMLPFQREVVRLFLDAKPVSTPQTESKP